MEMCPVCSKVSNMIISKSIRTETDSNGNKRRIETLSFHCEKCHQFIRSENKENGTGE